MFRILLFFCCHDFARKSWKGTEMVRYWAVLLKFQDSQDESKILSQTCVYVFCCTQLSILLFDSCSYIVIISRPFLFIYLYITSLKLCQLTVFEKQRIVMPNTWVCFNYYTKLSWEHLMIFPQRVTSKCRSNTENKQQFPEFHRWAVTRQNY